MRANRPNALLAALLLACSGASAQAQMPEAHSRIPPAVVLSEPALAYTVVPTDQLMALTLERLKHPKDWREVAQLNHLPDPDRIYPGQTIQIPLRLLKGRAATAKVISVSGTARKGQQSLTPGSSVQEGDQLQTGPNSAVVLELGDGSRVQVQSNSEMELTLSRRFGLGREQSLLESGFSGLLRLVRGALDIAATPQERRSTPLQVKTPTALVGVRGTQFRVGHDDPEQPVSRTEVLEGRVQADNPTQSSEALVSKGFGLVVDARVREMQVQALLPAPDLARSSDHLRWVGAGWRWSFPAVAGASAYRVQLAKDEALQDIRLDERLPCPLLSLSALKPESGPTSEPASGTSPGVWHVRVRAIAANGLEGLDAHKALQAPPARILRSEFERLENATVLHFDLKGGLPEGARLRVARDSAFRETVLNSPVQTEQAVLKHLPAGDYWVRIEIPSPDAPPVVTERYKMHLPPRSLGLKMLESTEGASSAPSGPAAAEVAVPSGSAPVQEANRFTCPPTE